MEIYEGEDGIEDDPSNEGKFETWQSNQEILEKEDAGNDNEEELIKIFQNLTRLHFMTHTSQHSERYCHPGIKSSKNDETSLRKAGQFSTRERNVYAFEKTSENKKSSTKRERLQSQRTNGLHSPT